MFSTPPHTSRHIEVTSVRTRRAYKNEQNKEKQNLTRDNRSEICKKENTEKDILVKRPKTDIDCAQKSILKHDKPVSTRKSRSSSASIEARRKELEYEAAKAKAELQAECERKEAEIKQNLIEKKLAADLAALEVHSHGSRNPSERHSVVDSEEKVQQWLERSGASDTNVQQGFEDSGTELKNLVSAIYQTNIQNKQLMSRIATSKDLPQYSGDSLEWLAFKQAYDESTKFCKYSDAENMWRLRKSLRGEAKETVSSLLIGNTTPHTVMEALELRYGRPEIIINKISYQLKKLSPLSHNFHHEIVPFSIKIKNFVAAVQAIKKTDYLRSPELVSTVLTKLPSTLINKWGDYYNINSHTDKAKLEILAEFLFNEANKISNAGLTHIYSQADYRKKPEERRQHAVLLSDKDDTPSKCKFCRVSNHNLTACARFKRAMMKDRWRFVRANRLCHKCLIASHNRDTCPEPTCGLDSCALPHHSLLHWKRSRPSSEIANKNNEKDSDLQVNNGSDMGNDSSGYNAIVAHARDDSRASVLLKVVPVKIKGPRGVLTTYALLDDGATVSLIAADIAERAGLGGRKQTLSIRGAWDSQLVCNSEIITCEVINTTNNKPFELYARKINELNLPIQKLSNINLKHYKHLENMRELLPCVNVKPKLLIGQDNYHLIAPIKTIINGKNSPCATLTQLGWCVHGVCPNQDHITSTECALLTNPYLAGYSTAHVSDRAATGKLLISSPAVTHTGADEPTTNQLQIIQSHVNASECLSRSRPNGTIHTDRENDERIHELVRKSFMFESIGVYKKKRQNEEELKAINIVDSTAVLCQGRWEVGLPWKNQNVQMADSYCNAYRRLKAIEKKMSYDCGYAVRYKERIHHLLVNYYAKNIDTSEVEEKFDRVWYLPHFGVDNPNKRKLRLVFDAAATTAGSSLNDYLLPGPNLLESLLGIMLRFREKCIGLAGDIKDMFLRIKIRREDRHALRFLWRDDPQTPVEKYVMTSLIFGANCAPFIAQHIKNKNALRYKTEMPEAVQAILKNHFMDDYIDCFDNTYDALKTMKEVSFIHQSGGFEMRNWTSNESNVCQGIPKASLSEAAVRFNIEQNDQSERILGLLWFPSTDTFGFNLSLQRIPAKMLSLEKRPTKRELLCVIMSIFDVYGFLAPFTIKAKILMQHCWKTDMEWDDEINTAHFEIFRHWITQLHELKNIRIPRWYFRPLNNNRNHTKTSVHETLEIHVFCDASPNAYAAVAYYRTHSDTDVCVSFIASKSRVAPIKPVTIPRMELQAAVLACRLADTIRKEHRLKAIKRYFWCDSMTVLHWIKNKSRTYNIFIANRLGEIDDLSSADEWHYISTDRNIADIATKTNLYKLENESEWFRGPHFLYENTESWFISPPETEKLSEEILEHINYVYEIESNNILPVPNIEKFSSWLRLLRCTANILLFIDKCRKISKSVMNTEILQRAEILLLRHSQRQSFATELLLLKNNKQIQANSRLRTLTPFLDESGLLRVGGRVGAASDVTMQVKSPIILDGRHPIAILLTKAYHIKYGHSNNETVVNELRQKYWLLKLRPTVRSIASKCLFCRIRNAKPSIPRMADLHEARLAHNTRPFSHCGVDLFGPMEVTVGRRRERRYGVLFTCMTIRAVHVELVPSLTTDSFIMALRRMAARRGWPQNMYSDNGTNLRGAEAELRTAYREIDQTTITEEMSNRGVKWSFNSPISPHKGGAWERLIRSVKTTLKVVLKERAPREETLATLLTEIENMVNSRPLTHVSVDPKSMEALTPNHFLIGSSSNLPVPGVFNDGDLYMRKMWRIAQRLTDMFWQRWVKEVLPTLIPRQKWYRENENLKPGGLVIIIDPNLPRNTWPKGIIEKVYPGRDGRIRTVDVRTKTGILTRPVHRLALLPLAD